MIIGNRKLIYSIFWVFTLYSCKSGDLPEQKYSAAIFGDDVDSSNATVSSSQFDEVSPMQSAYKHGTEQSRMDTVTQANVENGAVNLKITAQHSLDKANLEAEQAVEANAANACRGKIRSVENTGRSIRVEMCNGKIKTFKFQHRVVDIQRNNRYPYLAVYTTTFDAEPDTEAPSDAHRLFDGDEIFFINAQEDSKFRYRTPWTPMCHFNIWSPKGTYAAFLKGNVDVIKTVSLEKYLKNAFYRYREVNTNKKPSENNPGHVMEVIGWRTDTVLEVTGGCCGFSWKTEYDVEADTYRKVECAEGYCMTTGFGHFATNQKDIVIRGEKLTRFHASSEFRRYFESINNNCYALIDKGGNGDESGEFLLSFKLNPSGTVIEPSVTDIKSATLPVGNIEFHDCLIKFTSDMSFAAAEISGTESVSVHVLINPRDWRGKRYNGYSTGGLSVK